MNANNAEKKQANAFKLTFRWLWRLFSSVRLAVILILLITGLSLLGALLIQAPQEIVNNTQAYRDWIDSTARGVTGFWTPFLSALGLFNVFNSPWFITLGTLLMINILICSLNRWRGIIGNIRGGSIAHDKKFYSAGKTSAAINGLEKSGPDISSLLKKILKKWGYRTRTEENDAGIHIAADKNRYFKLGTYLSHFSLILFVMAFVLGSYFGFRDVSFSVSEGSIRDVGHNTTLALELTSFTSEYYDNGMPSDYRSHVILYDNGEPVRETDIRVNHPLIYKGIRFYQSYYGPAVKLQVTDSGGQDIFNEGVALDSVFITDGIKRLEGFFNLPETGNSVRIISTAVNAEDFIIPPGSIAVDIRDSNGVQTGFKLARLGTPVGISGLEFTFLDQADYSGFQVSSDPGNILIWIASTLFVIGICMVLYFPYRQIWVLIGQQEKGRSRINLRSRAPRGYRSASELNEITGLINDELKNNK